ncbi:hypothetical protein [Amycolatopsis sp. NPDC003861]
MAVRRMHVDFFTQAELGRGGLEELGHNLWPSACQTCGQPLEREDPALVVVEFVEVTASLHHRACQRPRWTRTPLPTGTRYNSTSARLVGVPFGDPGRDPFVPTILVNPSHEMVGLAADAKGRYRCTTVGEWKMLGLQRPGGQIPHGSRSEMALWLREDAVIVRCGSRLWFIPISHPGDPRIEEIRRSGEAVLAISTGMEPASMSNPDQIRRVLSTGDVALARVRLDSSTAPPPIEGHAVMLESHTDEDNELSWLPKHAPYVGPTYDPAIGLFDMGVSMDGPSHWRLNTPGAGAANGIVTGPAGMGKTNLLRMVGVEAVASGLFDLAVADPLDRNGLRATFSSAANSAAGTIDDTISLLQHVAEQIRKRPATGPALDPTPRSPGLIVLLDDAHLVLDEPSAAAAAETIAVDGPRIAVGLVVATESAGLAGFGHRERLLRALCRDNCFALSKPHFEALAPYRSRR